MFGKVSTITMASNDIDAVKKTYTEVLRLAPPIQSTDYPKGRYKEHTLTHGVLWALMARRSTQPGQNS